MELSPEQAQITAEHFDFCRKKTDSTLTIPSSRSKLADLSLHAGIVKELQTTTAPATQLLAVRNLVDVDAELASLQMYARLPSPCIPVRFP